MIEVRYRTAASRGTIRLKPVAGTAFGNYEWTARLPAARSNDPIQYDLLRLGQAVYLADRAVRRPFGIGNLLRTLEVTVPVREWKRMRRVAARFEELAEFATCDGWRLRFTKLHEAAGAAGKPAGDPVDVVSLFSAGLDSLCGAAVAAKRGGTAVFVTHSPPGREATRDLVRQVYERLGRPPPADECFAAYRLETREVAEEGRHAVFPEHSRRSRPFFFLCQAAATAVRVGAPRVCMNENGALALSLPIRADTHGASMARQAHSYLLSGFTSAMAELGLGDAPVPEFDNPFLRLTKGEACRHLGNASRLARRALSCEYTGRQRALLLRWLKRHPRRAARFGRGPQCGLCVPCIVRRAALKHAGVDDPASDYFADAAAVARLVRERASAVDVFGSAGDAPPLLNVVASNVVHVSRFGEALRSMSPRDFALRYLPELRANRPIASSPALRPDECLRLMRRFAGEVLRFLDGR